MPPTESNAAQIDYWNHTAGPRWLAADDHLARLLGPLQTPLVERAAAAPSERILDVGCGSGQSSAVLAEQVGAHGSVLGVDISAPLLSRARTRAAALPQLAFAQADAQTHAFAPGAFDLVFSRFGVMFFADPIAAFTNLAAATRAGGRLVFACWRAFIENPWMAQGCAAMAKHITPAPPPDPGAPGPFSFADAGHVRSVLESAGWSRVALEPFDTRLQIGVDVDDALHFATEIGPTAAPLRDAEPAARQAALEAMRETYAAARGDHGVEFGGAIWLVTASR